MRCGNIISRVDSEFRACMSSVQTCNSLHQQPILAHKDTKKKSKRSNGPCFTKVIPVVLSCVVPAGTC